MLLITRLAAALGAAGLVTALAAAEPVASAEPLLAANTVSVPTLRPRPLTADVPGSQADEGEAVSAKADLGAVSTQPDPLAPLATDADEMRAVRKGMTLASLVTRLRSVVAGNREMECLAGAIYFESKSEPLAGQLAVGEVIANRTQSGRFPKSYCGVVYQPGQFSFVRGRSMPSINRNHVQWKNAVAIARIVDRKLHDVTVKGALFFHARRVAPGWRMTRVASLGNHIFYR